MLASRNPAKIYITGRNEAAAQQTISDIKSAGSTAKVEWIHCDHADLYSVVEAAQKILAQESRLDVLMTNAGVSKHTQTPVDCLRSHAINVSWRMDIGFHQPDKSDSNPLTQTCSLSVTVHFD